MGKDYRQDLNERLSKDIGKNRFLDHEESRIVKRSEVTGKILKYLRKRVGFTQKDIAQKVGIVQQTYAGYESGQHEPNLEIMIRLANVYNTSMDYITGRYWGIDEQRMIMEEVEVEQYLDNTVMHYEIQRMQDAEYMEMVRKQHTQKASG